MRSLVICWMAICAGLPAADAANLSFRGNFFEDDDVAFVQFVVDLPSTVTLRSYSYAGGANAQGEIIQRGGFDPILALFRSTTGVRVGKNDDGDCSDVQADLGTGACRDFYLVIDLNPGIYTAAVTQYDNFSRGPNLSDGFDREGDGNYTSEFGNCFNIDQFCDSTGRFPFNARLSYWAVDVFNVTPIPEPGSASMILLGAAALLAFRKALLWKA